MNLHRVLTLNEFVIERQSEFPYAKGELTRLLSHIGIASKIVTDVFKSVGIEVEYSFYPWKRAFIIAKENRWDGTIIWTKSIAREKDFYFSKYPILNVKDVFFYNRTKKITLKKIEDLKGKTLGVTLGYSYGEEFINAIKTV